MRVLHVLGNYPLPALGGMETVVVELAEALVATGVESRVVAASRVSRQASEFGTEFFGVPSAFVSNWIQVPSPKALVALQAHVRWADIVHIHNPPELFNLTAIEIAHLNDRPYVLSMLSPGQLTSHPRLLYRWAGTAGEWLVHQAVSHSAAIQVKNTADYEYARRWNTDSFLIPDGVAASILNAPYPPPGDSPLAPRTWTRPMLLYLGRLHPLKGPEELVRGLPSVLAQCPGATAVIAGPDPGGMADRLNALARALRVSEHVRLLGPVDDATKLALLDASDVVVIPSLANFVEGFSIVASEAWARRKPVAAFPVGALRVRVQEGRNGSLARSMSPDDLAEAVVRALGIARVEVPDDVVSWPVVAERFRTVYSNVLRGSHPPPPTKPTA